MVNALQDFGLSIDLCDNNLKFTGKVMPFYVTQVSSKMGLASRHGL